MALVLGAAQAAADWPAPPIADLVDAFGAGVYLLFAIIQLDLWTRRRDRTAHLWLAGAGLSALAVDITGVVLRRLLPDQPSLLMAINTLAVAGTTVFLFELASSFSPSRPGRIARGAQGALLAIALMNGLLLPGLQAAVLVGSGALLLWSLALAVRSARRGSRESRGVALGFAALVVCLVADLLKELQVAPIPSGLPILGFTVLFLASARSLHDRFEREEAASRTDSLTGLANRRGFLEASDNALARSRRSGQPVSIVLGDLDDFKQINDTLGHGAGDLVLRSVAAAIRSSLRGQDLVARWGGDEFVLLLPDTPMEGARSAAESVRKKLEALPIAHQGSAISVTLSLGVAEHSLGRSLEETIAHADEALYQAKSAGRNRVAAK
jgi:diguanylate cyclase (GGDEF)-like protein